MVTAGEIELEEAHVLSRGFGRRGLRIESRTCGTLILVYCRSRRRRRRGVRGVKAGDGPEDDTILIEGLGEDEIVVKCGTSMQLVKG